MCLSETVQYPKFILNLNKSTGIGGMGHNHIFNIQGKLPYFFLNQLYVTVVVADINFLFCADYLLRDLLQISPLTLGECKPIN